MNTTTVSDYLTGLDDPIRDIGEKLRTIIDAALTSATSAMWHGHPTWGRGERPGQDPICLLKAYSSDITFGFWHGQRLTDPSGRLVAGARQMASVKLRTVDDIDPGLFTDWLRQAYELESR
ncbi:DUF1801 domain-containing protein [Actinomycetes bacterium KLBMP 9797]